MAVITMHNAELKIDNGIGGSLTSYHAQCTKATLTTTPKTGEHFTFGTRGGRQTVGGYSNVVEVTVRNETTATSLYGILMAIVASGTLATYGGTLSFQLGAPDIATTGSHLYSGEVVAVDAGTPVTGEAGKGEVQTTTFKLNVDGNITYAVV